MSAAAEPPASEADQPIDAKEAERIKRRARLGAIALTLRSVVTQLTIFGGGVVLARILAPADFGVYVILLFAISFFGFFGDVGLGASLVRQKEEPTQTQLSTVFWFQTGMASAILVVVAIAATFLRLVWPQLPESAPWMMRALALDLLLTVLRAVPSMLLERDQQLPKIAVVEAVSQASFYFVAIPLAYLGFGAWALAIGLLAQGVVNLVGILPLRPWRPSFVFDREVLKPMLKFGLAYQGKVFIGFVNAAVTPL